MSKKQRFELRLPPDQMTEMKRIARDRGFRSANAYIESILRREFRDGDGGTVEKDAIVAASIDRLAKDVRTLHNAHQALFALTDSLIRLFLTCVPEPPAETIDMARRRAKLRYDRFLVSVARNMTADSRAAMTELIDRG